MFETDPEVLVAGAGPVGMFAALALARKDTKVAVLDTGWQPGMHSYALALHARSVEAFRSLGLYQLVTESAYPVRKIALYDETTRRAEVNLSGEPVLVLRQDVLEDILEAAIEDAGGHVCWSHRLSRASMQGDYVSATVEALEKESRGYSVAHTEWVVASSNEVKPRYVIGADGNSSWVRRMLRVGFPEIARPQYFAVFEFDSDADLSHEMRIALSRGTTNIVWPMPESRVRWSFELPGYAMRDAQREKDRSALQLEAGSFPVLSEESLRELLATRVPWFTASIGEIAWRIVVRFERRLADCFGCGRVWLAGDAAHLTGPGGVQSMNSGLGEAMELSGILARGVGGEDVSGALSDYGSRHLAAWRRLLGISGGLRAKAEADPWIAANCHELLPCLPGTGEEVAAMARQLGLEFAAGAAVKA